MSKYVVQVEGRLIVEAEDKDAAKEIVGGVLADQQSWLKVGYQPAEKMAEVQEVFDSSTAKLCQCGRCEE